MLSRVSANTRPIQFSGAYVVETHASKPEEKRELINTLAQHYRVDATTNPNVFLVASLLNNETVPRLVNQFHANAVNVTKAGLNNIRGFMWNEQGMRQIQNMFDMFKHLRIAQFQSPKDMQWIQTLPETQ